MRSGRLVTVNDALIDTFVSDPNYRVMADGSVWTKLNKAGVPTDVWSKKAFSPSKGYYFIKYRGKCLSIHRIVYRTHGGPLASDLSINHKDGNGLNNRIENLELVTQAENNLHRFRNLGMKPVCGARKLSVEQADEIRRLNESGVSYKKLASLFGVAKTTIAYICQNRTYQKSS